MSQHVKTIHTEEMSLPWHTYKQNKLNETHTQPSNKTKTGV